MLRLVQLIPYQIRKLHTRYSNYFRLKVWKGCIEMTVPDKSNSSKQKHKKLKDIVIETYEEKLVKVELYEKLAVAESQLNNGEKLLDAADVFKRLRSKYVR